MSPAPNLRASQLTPIPEHSPHFTALPSHLIMPSNFNMATSTPTHPGLPLSYYNVPELMPAIFSTRLVSRPKRKLVEPYPPVIARTNLAVDVQRKAQDLWKRFPNEVRRVQLIYDWYQLYQYFDAVDLWVEGPAFCFCVIHRLAVMNREIRIEATSEISQFAKSWVNANSRRVLNVVDHIPIFNLFTAEDLENERFDLLTQGEIEQVKEQLEYFRRALKERCGAAPGPTYMTFNGQSEPVQGTAVQHQYQNHAQGPVNRHREQAPRPEFDHLTVQTLQNYHNFMEHQRNLHGPPRGESSSRENRPRGWSNETSRGGRGGSNPRFNNGAQYQNTKNWNADTRTPKASPQKQRDQPVYILTGQRRASSDRHYSSRPNLPIRQRTISGASRHGFSNDARKLPDSPLGRRAASEETRALSGYSTVERTYSNHHARVFSGSSNGAGNPYYEPARNNTRVPQVSNDARVANGKMESSPSKTHSRRSTNEAGHQRFDLRAEGQAELAQLAPDIIEGYEHTVAQNGSVTIFYSGPVRRIEISRQAQRTVFISGVPRYMFTNHALRDMMSECGDVDTISHLQNPVGQSFVAFHDESSVQRAIERWDGYTIVPGVNLLVKTPTQKRDRGFSMSSNNNGYGRMMSLRTSPGREAPHYGQAARSHARAFSADVMRGDQFRPVPEVLRDRYTSSHGGSLQNIQTQSPNHEPATPKAEKAFFHSNMATPNRKENSPLATPRERNSQTPTPKHKGKTSNNKKGSNQSSRQPTPSGSPVRFRLERRLTMPEVETVDGAQLTSCTSEQASQLERVIEHPASRLAPALKTVSVPTTQFSQTVEEEPSELSSTAVNGFAQQLPDNDLVAVHTDNSQSSEAAPKKSKTKSKKQKHSTLSKNSGNESNASFCTDASSDTIVSPVSNENSFSGSQSTNTSFSTASSREPSVTSVRVQKATDPEKKAEVSLETKSEERRDGEKKAIMDEGTAKVPKSKQHKIRKPSKTTPILRESIQQPNESLHLKKDSTSSTTSNPSLRKADAMKKAENKPSPVPSPPATTSVSNVSSASNKQDATPNDPPTQVGDSLTSASETVQSPKALDEQEWPSLNPTKSPVDKVADGKPPTPIRPPVMGSLVKAVKENSPGTKTIPKSIFPLVAVPLSFTSRSPRSPSTNTFLSDDRGTRLWPFVKNFKTR